MKSVPFLKNTAQPSPRHIKTVPFVKNILVAFMFPAVDVVVLVVDVVDDVISSLSIRSQFEITSI